MKRSTEPRQSIPPPTLLTSFEKFDLEKYRNMDPRDLTSDEFLMRIKLLSDTLMTTRRELDTVILQRDELFSKYDEVTLTLCDREKQLAYCEDLIVLSQRDRSQSQPQEQWKEVSDQDQDQDPLPLTPAEQDRLQDASSAALSGMRSVLEEKNRLIERYREKIDKLQSEVPMKSNVDRRAEALLQSLDTDALLVTRSVEFFEDSKEIDRYDRHAGKAESSDAMLSEKNRKINLLETTVETELLRRERAELRCAESVQEMDAMKADMLMLVQRLRQSEQRYVQLLAISSSVDAKPTVVRQSSVRKQEEKEDDEEGRNEEKTIEKGDTEDILDDTINAVDASFVTSPIRSDSTDHLKLHRIVKVREEQIRKHRDVTTKLKAEIVRMEQQHAVALLKVSSTVSKKSDYVPSSGDDLNDLKRQVITLRDTLRETKDDLERSRKAREKLIQLKHSALEDARALASQLTRAEAQAQAYQDTLQRTRSELEETKKKEKKLREKVKEYGADPDLALVSQSSSPRGASIALHKECIMLRTQNAQLRQVITQAALATDDSDSPGKKRKSTLAFLDVEESKNDSYTSEKDENDGYFNGETKLLKRFVNSFTCVLVY